MDGIAFFVPPEVFAYLYAVIPLNPLLTEITGVFSKFLEQRVLDIAPYLFRGSHRQI